MGKHFKKVLLTAVLILALTGCVSPPPLPLPPPPSFQFDTLDTSALRGKVIVIDPGHGGRYKGAIGKMGLKESDVNLGVALYLWGFLYSAGARPVLTRTADTTVAPPSHRVLNQDLLARSRVSNDLAADFFVSIHHNSNIYDPKKNTLEIYYKLVDAGPSKELAECIMKRIQDVFEMDSAQVLSGNYSVLRNATSPAILGEASYLTHRENERKLTLHGFLRSEAEAYFLGILDYFSKGVPKILDLTPQVEVISHAQPEIVGWVQDDGRGGGINPGSIVLSLDGALVTHRYDPSTGKVSGIPRNSLISGGHTLCMEAKNFKGNSARSFCTFFKIALPPAQVKLSPIHNTIPADGSSRCRIEAEILDENNNHVADGTVVSFTTSAGKLGSAFAVTRRGKVITHVIADYQTGWAEVVAACEGVAGSTAIAFDAPKEATLQVYVGDRKGSPLEGAELYFSDGSYAVIDQLGYGFYHGAGSERMECTVWKKGYLSFKSFLKVAAGEGMQETVTLAPVDQGLMWDKVVVIDPRGEDEDTAFYSDAQQSRSEVNLQTALCLKELLELAGAEVVLTRENESIPTPRESTKKANEVSADLLLSLNHGKGSSPLGYYFNSTRGKLLASSLTQALDEVASCKGLKMMESSEFILVHTTMPAVAVTLDARSCKGLAKDSEERAWGEAQALYQGLRYYFKKVDE